MGGGDKGDMGDTGGRRRHGGRDVGDMRGQGGTCRLTPDVMMTDWKRSKTGLMAMEASIQLGTHTHTHPWGDTATAPPLCPQHPCVPPLPDTLPCPPLCPHLKCRMGLEMVGVLLSKGSMMMVKPGAGR